MKGDFVELQHAIRQLPERHRLAIRLFQLPPDMLPEAWAIFLFLLPIVLSPFIVMAVMYWRFAGRRSEAEEQEVIEAGDKDDEIHSTGSDNNAAAAGDVDRSDDV